MSSLPTAIPVGSLVLITGASGFLASHISLQLLDRGFKVRGTVRDPAQSSWLLEGRFKPFADTGAFELFAVPDMGAEGAYDEAIKGTSAIIHTAFVTNIVPDPNEVITPMLTAVRSIINAAKHEPSVKKFVFTSSGKAASPLTPHVDNGTIGRNSWDDAVLDVAWAPPPYGMSHAMANYPASKVAAEKEVWKFVNEGDLPFDVNVVVPGGLIGEPLHKKHVENQGNWMVHAYRGAAAMAMMPASIYGDVKDIALIHVAAVLDPKVNGARIHAWGHKAHWNDVLGIMRKLRPDHKFVDDYPDPYQLQFELDQSEAIALLKKWSKTPGKDGFTTLEDGVKESILTPFLED